MATKQATRPSSTSKDETQESWKNATPGTVTLKRLDHRGELTRDEIVAGGRTFHITPQERKINMEIAADPSLDVFRNGTLVPVRLLDGTEDARELASNPNLLTESDMRALVKSADLADKVGQITNMAALERMLRIAEQEDAPISALRTVQTRLNAMRQGPVRDSRPTSSTGAPVSEKRPRGVTPR